MIEVAVPLMHGLRAHGTTMTWIFSRVIAVKYAADCRNCTVFTSRYFWCPESLDAWSSWVDHDLNSQLRQYAADKSSRDYCFGMPEPKNSVVCGIHLQLQVIVQGDKIPWYYHDSWYRYHTYFLSKRFPNLLMSSPVPSFPWTRLLTCPVLNPFSPISGTQWAVLWTALWTGDRQSTDE